MMDGFPTILKLLHHAPARLRETRVAQLAVVHEHLPPCGLDGLPHGLGRGARDALIALAMVVGAHIKVSVVVVVPPLDEFVAVVLLRGTEGGCQIVGSGTVGSLLGIVGLNLRQ